MLFIYKKKTVRRSVKPRASNQQKYMSPGLPDFKGALALRYIY